MSDTNLATPPAANAPEARTPTGEIKTPEPTKVETKVEPEVKVEPKVEADKGKTVLTDGVKKDETPPGAPEKYEPFTVPEGFTLSETISKEAGDLFKGLNLSQPQAQSLIDFYATKSAEAAKAPYKLWQDTQDQWKNEIKADPEIGGKLDQVKITVARAIDGLGDPKLASAFREAMDYTGAGNNPAFIRALYKLSQKVTEGTHVSGKGPVEVKNPDSRPRSPASALYPNLP